MPSHEAILMRSARLVEASDERVFKWKQRESSDRTLLERSVFAVDESRLILAESDKAIVNSGTVRFLHQSQ